MTLSASYQPLPRTRAVRERLLLLLAVALDLFLFSDIAASESARMYGPQTNPAVLIAYAAVAYALLLVRRRARFMVLLLLCGCSAVASVTLSYSPVIAVCIALAGAVGHCSMRWGVAGLVAAGLTSITWVYREDRADGWSLSWNSIVGVQVACLTVVLISAGIGWWIQVNERNAAWRRAEAAKAAVAAERQRVARELHDIVAHAVTMMVLQSSGARAVMATDPARADDALKVVEKTGTQAMAELRRLLGVLRSSSDQDTRNTEELDLPPGLDELPHLVEAVSAAGVHVSMNTEGQPHRIDRSVDAAAYRIVSESLTNVTKHSGPGTNAEVLVKWTPTHLTIDVRDDGAGAGSDQRLSTGNGLLGLTERVVLVGGSVEARPRASGGYEVHASLPLPASDRDQPAAVRAP